MKKLWKLLIPTLLLGVAPALQADPPDCNPFCTTSICHSQSDCPGGRCAFACPGTGCCVP